MTADPLHELRLAADFARAATILYSLPPQDVRQLRDILCRWILASESEVPVGPIDPTRAIALLFYGVEMALTGHPMEPGHRGEAAP
jgi:hypothetical protein